MATKGHGVTLGYADLPLGGSPSYTGVAKVVDVKPPNVEAEKIDVSTMESPEQWEEITAGWAAASEAELTLQYTKADTATLYGLFRADKGFKLSFSDGSYWSYQGFIQKMGNEVERKGIIQTAVTIAISGKPTFTAAS